jgi:hypothetical protein
MDMPPWMTHFDHVSRITHFDDVSRITHFDDVSFWVCNLLVKGTPSPGGAGNILISRDLWRLSTRMDMFRCLHFFYSGCG